MPTNNKGIKSLWGYDLIDEKARNAISDTRSSLENNFQKKTDDTLGTTDKTVPGAINEIKNNIDTIGDNFTSEQSDTKYDMKYKGKSIGSINMELTEDKIIGEGGSFNIDLTPYQTKTDTSLTTNNKTINGAINEVKNNIDTIEDSQIILVEDETSMTGINDKKYPTLSTSDKTLIGSINEVSEQCKNITIKNKINISSLCKNKQLTSDGYEVNLQEIVNQSDLLELNIDVNIFCNSPLNLKNNFIMYSSNGSNLKFKGCDGIVHSAGTRLKNVKVYNLNILGDKTANTTLLKLSGDCENCSFYELNILNGYDGMNVDGWVYIFHDIRINACTHVGCIINKSDNIYYNFYINGCDSYGLQLNSTNNKIYNFKILSCNPTGYSCVMEGNRNNINNFEIQDIYKKAVLFKNFQQNDIAINIDGIRTNLASDAQINICDFENSNNNIINIISSKYGECVNENSPFDIISFDDKSYNNIINSTLEKVKFTGNYNNDINDTINKKYDYIGEDMTSNLSFELNGSTSIDSNNKLKGFTTQAEVTWGGYRINIDKTNTNNGELHTGKYILSAILTVDKDSTFSVTDQGEPADVNIKKIYSNRYNEIKFLITISDTSGVSLAINSTMPESTVIFLKIKLYKVSDDLEKDDLFFI